MNNNTKTTNITLNITCSYNLDIEVKDGKVSWSDVYNKLSELEGKMPEGLYIQDWDDYYLGKENLESDLNDEGIELDD